MGTLSLSDYEDVRIWAPWGHIAGRWYGNRMERPILAIHGWLDNLGTFDTLIPLLPDYLGVLCIDLPGHGRSSHLPAGIQYNTTEFSFIIPRIMKEYKWKKVSLMGHSLGGMLSFLFTVIAPHMVDMVISLDIITFHLPESPQIWFSKTENFLLEEERMERSEYYEPPSYTFAQLCKLVSQSTSNSVTPKLTKHLLYRSVAKSQLYPDKFFFSRDRRVKFLPIVTLSRAQAAEYAHRIKNNPYLVLKANSKFIDSWANDVISILGNDNPQFEYYEVPGAHYAHLTHAAECAQHIIPFLQQHRPPPVASGFLPREEATLKQRSKL